MREISDFSFEQEKLRKISIVEEILRIEEKTELRKNPASHFEESQVI